MKNPDLISHTIYYQLVDLFEISSIYHHEAQLFFRAVPRIKQSEAILRMKKRLNASGFDSAVKEVDDGLMITISKSTKRQIPWVNIILFLATIATMFFAPFFWSFNFNYFSFPGAINNRIEFTVALMAILLFHEFGHYLVGRRRGVLMSLPYFLPAPNIIGTFGAVIKSKSPFTNRRDLLEVGAAGPIAGFVVSVVVLSIGLQNTEIVSLPAVSGLELGDSILMRFLSWLIVGPVPNNYGYLLSPAAEAGWFGLLVTMINLLPLGQLDGGHIMYGLIGRHQHKISKLFLLTMIGLGFLWPGWWFFGILVFIFGINHKPTFNDSIKPTRTAKIMGIIAIIIFIISFIPAPFIME